MMMHACVNIAAAGGGPTQGAARVVDTMYTLGQQGVVHLVGFWCVVVVRLLLCVCCCAGSFVRCQDY